MQRIGVIMDFSGRPVPVKPNRLWTSLVCFTVLFLCTFVAFCQEKKSVPVAQLENVEITAINKSVADFPDRIDLTTPEAAYALVAKIMGEDRPDKIDVLSLYTLGPGKIPKPVQEQIQSMSKEMKESLQKAKIVKTFVYKGRSAMVVAELAEPHVFYFLWMRKQDGIWLSFGNGSVKNMKTAENAFANQVENVWSKEKEPWKTPDNVGFTHVFTFGPHDSFKPGSDEEMYEKLQAELKTRNDIITGYTTFRNGEGKIFTNTPGSLKEVFDSIPELNLLKTEELDAILFKELVGVEAGPEIAEQTENAVSARMRSPIWHLEQEAQDQLPAIDTWNGNAEMISMRICMRQGGATWLGLTKEQRTRLAYLGKPNEIGVEWFQKMREEHNAEYLEAEDAPRNLIPSDDPLFERASEEQKRAYVEATSKVMFMFHQHVTKEVKETLTPEQYAKLCTLKFALLPRMGYPTPQMFDSLGLSEEQQQKIEAIKTEFQPEFEKLLAEKSEARKLHLMLYAEGKDSSKDENFLTLHRRSEKKLRDFSLQLKERLFSDVLTEEQRKQAQELENQLPGALKRMVVELQQEALREEEQEELESFGDLISRRLVERCVHNVQINGETIAVPYIKMGINKPLSQYPEEYDLSTPENAYVTYNRVMHRPNEDHATAFFKLSVPEMERRFTVANRNELNEPIDENWSKIMLGAKILEVLQFGDERANVVAKLYGENVSSPIDVRGFEKINGEWRQTGNDRFDTIEEAEEKFRRIIRYYLEKKATKELVVQLKDREDVRIYDVNKRVSEFGNEKNATPEELYATMNMIMGSKSEEVIAKLAMFNTPENQNIPEREIQMFESMPEEWANILKTAEIKKVYVFADKYALVIAFLDGEETRNPFDLRWAKKIDGKWYNSGNDRVASEEDGAEAFAKQIAVWEKE